MLTSFTSKWITPFAKQCFVVVGVSVHMGEFGMLMGIAVSMMHQLKVDPSGISIGDDGGSWIASLPGMAQILGNLAVPMLMGKYGRKKANIISIIILIVGWMLLIIAKSLVTLLIGRFLQGVSSGMCLCCVTITIGEYSSPKNRGAFSFLMTCILGGSVLFVHSVGYYLKWRTLAVICMVISVVSLVMVVMSPETPSWLADHGRYEECRRVFRWLRGDGEEDELDKMIVASKTYNDSKDSQDKSFRATIAGFFSTLRKKEVYKPIIIMIHLYVLGQISGVNLMTAYMADLIHLTIGKDTDTFAYLLSLGSVRLLSSIAAIFLIKRTRRRIMLFTTVVLNILVLLVSAGYVYCKDHSLLPYDNPAIGGILLHLFIAILGIGTVPLSFTIPSEIFPIKYRSVSGGICLVFFSLCVFINIKTFPTLCEAVSLAGAYCVYALCTGYCFVVVWMLMPETKDRTLQDIEEEFRGK